MGSNAINISLNNFSPTSRILEATSTHLGTQRAENTDQQRLPRHVRLEDNSENKKNTDSLELSPPEKAKKSHQTEQKKSKGDSDKKNTDDSNGLSEDEQAVVDQLKKIDAKVRAHEQAHMLAASGLGASAPQFSYSVGPDGKQYAIGGSVNIDTSAAQNPEATIQKMQKVIAAANAPTDPSAQDRAVASSAAQMINQARAELIKENSSSENNESTNSLLSESTSDQIKGRYVDFSA